MIQDQSKCVCGRECFGEASVRGVQGGAAVFNSFEIAQRGNKRQPDAVPLPARFRRALRPNEGAMVFPLEMWQICPEFTSKEIKLLLALRSSSAANFHSGFWMLGKLWSSPDTGVLSKDRHKCYEARDKYYTCVDALNRSEDCDPKVVPKECKQLRKAYEKNCRKTWVNHFDRLRNRDIQLLKTIAKNVKESPQKGSLSGEAQS